MKCPKCENEMENGFIVDNTYSRFLKSSWASGFVKKIFGSVPDNQKEIESYRCNKCGFLENYAK